MATAHETGTSDRTITVRGTGKVTVQPDIADVRLGVLVRRPSVAQARDEAAVAMRGILDAVTAAGVASGDIRTSLLSVQPAWEHDPKANRPTLVGHEVANAVTVLVRDLDRLGSTVDAALAAGATSLDGLDVRVAEPSAPEADARAKAVADARTRAEALAGAAGLRIAGVLAIAETGTRGPIAPMPRFAVAEMAAETPFEAGRTEITVTVEVVFDVEPAPRG